MARPATPNDELARLRRLRDSLESRLDGCKDYVYAPLARIYVDTLSRITELEEPLKPRESTPLDELVARMAAKSGGGIARSPMDA